MNKPKGAFMRECMPIMKTAVPILTGILSKMLLDVKTTKLSVTVRSEILIIPNKGVQIKNLLYIREEK